MVHFIIDNLLDSVANPGKIQVLCHIVGIMTVLGKKTFPLPFKVLVPSLRIKLTWGINKRKKQSLIACPWRPSNEIETLR